jgi:predicted PhzF superfamily epimerase YddE/YHI9
MRVPLYQVDAFTGTLFRGNPAAVCPLERWLDDTTLQAIAAENNLAETAFFVPRGDDYDLRWFAPASEVDLCGHATLASAFVLFDRLAYRRPSITFHTKSGPLVVARDGGRLVMDFPSRPPVPCPAPAGLSEALRARPRETLRARDLVAVFDDEDQVRALRPDMEAVARLDTFAVAATARGRAVDFVSRFFAPRAGVPEDPVTGSSHCSLVPLWAGRLGKGSLLAHQVSPRGGEIRCELRGDRVRLSGEAVLYLEGTIELP